MSGVLRDVDNKEVPTPDYTDKEKVYLGAMRKRLVATKQSRDTNHDVFDGMTYIERCASNRRGATSYIKPRKNRQESNFTTGKSRKQLMVDLAGLVNLNLEPDITAYDRNDLGLTELGEAMENILEKSRDIDGDEEKKLMRQYTLMEQGEVYVEVMWKKGFELKKTMQNFASGRFRNVEIRSRLKKSLGRLTSNVIMNEKVYLGDITQPIVKEQPHLFTAESQPYESLQAIFEGYEMWKYVPKDMTSFTSEVANADTGYLSAWTIGTVKKGRVEIIKYQSITDNEFQIFLNGIPMLPIGFPLSEITPDSTYLLEGQIFSIIDAHFAYGKSLIQILKTSQALEDEFWKLTLLKGQQGAIPSMINNTGRAMSSRMLMPGVIIPNIPPDKFKPLLDSQLRGVTSNETQVLSLLRDNIEDNSSSEQFGGQAVKKNTTAEEVSTVQAQAEKLFGLTVFPAALLEKKIAEKAIPILLANWFDPVDEVVDKVRNSLVPVYRRSNVEKPIDGEGIGQQVVEVVGKGAVPSPFEIFKQEQEIFNSTGIPTRKIVLSSEMMHTMKTTYAVAVVPTPKRSSNMQKMMFREEANVFALSPNFSMDWFEETAATTYGRNPQKVFNRSGGNVAAGVNAPPAPLNTDVAKDKEIGAGGSV